MKAYIALGSNMGDRRAHLRAAIAAMGDSALVSRLYETEPIGGPPSQAPYLNIVVALDTDASPRGLLEMCRRLETAGGRRRGERWGPRTLDADVLLVGDLVVDEPDLVVPHPRMFERAFVLVPLADVAPEYAHHLEGIDTSGIRRVADL